jgi:hypothetical protein
LQAAPAAIYWPADRELPAPDYFGKRKRLAAHFIIIKEPFSGFDNFTTFAGYDII